ncbi:hypothetical protein D3C87_1463360 [compost metagenome]
MKSIFATLVVLSAINVQALPKTVLHCSNVDQGDIRSVIVTTSEKNQDLGVLEMTLFNANGESKDLVISDEDFNEGWIPLPNDDVAERYLIRQADGWEVFSMIGDENLFSKADCEEFDL